LGDLGLLKSIWKITKLSGSTFLRLFSVCSARTSLGPSGSVDELEFKGKNIDGKGFNELNEEWGLRNFNG
jgi:hypothetical protein